MLKAMFAGTTALTLLGGSLVYAQQTPPTQPGSNAVQQRSVFTPAERAARTDARIAELKTELQLKPAQEKNWQTFEVALREAAKLRAERFEQFHKMREQSEATQRANNRAEATAAEIAEQKRLAAALDPLYKSLDDGQKQHFAAKFRIDGEGRHFWFRGQRGKQNERS